MASPDGDELGQISDRLVAMWRKIRDDTLDAAVYAHQARMAGRNFGKIESTRRAVDAHQVIARKRARFRRLLDDRDRRRAVDAVGALDTAIYAHGAQMAVRHSRSFVEFAARQADGSFGPYRRIGNFVSLETTPYVDTNPYLASGRSWHAIQKTREAAADHYRPKPLGERPAIFKGRPEG